MRNNHQRARRSRNGYRSFRPRRAFGGRQAPDYNPMMFVRHAAPEIESEKYVPEHVFTDFALHSQLVANVVAKGYKIPTPIQDKAIPALLKGEDVVGIANTGTGKTAAFLIPLINKMIANKSEKALIVAPTRELAVQVEKEFRDLARETGAYSAICIGGVGIGGQIDRLRRNPQLVVGTPGRLKDLEERRAINFAGYGSIVLDEVDRMLDMGFVHDVTHIVSRLASPRHSLFFSATLPQSVRSIMSRFSANPLIITIESEPTSANVDQDIIRLNGRDKLAVLDELLSDREFEKVLVFGRTKRGIDRIERELLRRRIAVASIHGNKSQGQRQAALERFKQSRVQVLLATDLASRGLDIDNVTHVVNYDLPMSYEDYIHRIGRTGRANKKGKALTFID